MRDFKGTIWTNHALEKLKKRGIKQSDAWAVWRNPDSTRYAKNKGAWIYKRRIGASDIEVVAKEEMQRSGKKKWLILSVWSKDSILSDERKSKGKSYLSRFLRKLKLIS